MWVCTANLRRLMTQHNVTVSQLSAKSGLKETRVRAILADACRADAATLRRLAVGLSVSPADLFVDPPHGALHNGPAVESLVQSHPELRRKLAVLLETSQSDVIEGIIEILYRTIASDGS